VFLLIYFGVGDRVKPFFPSWGPRCSPSWDFSLSSFRSPGVWHFLLPFFPFCRYRASRLDEGAAGPRGRVLLASPKSLPPWLVLRCRVSTPGKFSLTLSLRPDLGIVLSCRLFAWSLCHQGLPPGHFLKKPPARLHFFPTTLNQGPEGALRLPRNLCRFFFNVFFFLGHLPVGYLGLAVHFFFTFFSLGVILSSLFVSGLICLLLSWMSCLYRGFF